MPAYFIGDGQMNLVIDIGNTRIKAGLFESNELTEVLFFEDESSLMVYVSNTQHRPILSSVRKPNPSLIHLISEKNGMILSHETDLPIKLNYSTPHTLGLDRIAATCGALDIAPSGALIVDIGTCITLDVLSPQAEFRGGNISPGPELRFSSMHHLTASLPMETLNPSSESFGTSTQTALQSGVEQGIIHEITGSFAHLLTKYPHAILVLTGGYTSYFDSKLKQSIFAEPNLVLKGLNSILNYNVKK